MRLIDGSALEERCKRQMSDEWNKEASPYSWANAYEQFLTDIENCATIDAVPVVRCRDCKYSDTFTPDCTEATFPLKCLSIRYGGVYPNWFCEHGERKDGDA